MIGPGQSESRMQGLIEHDYSGYFLGHDSRYSLFGSRWW